MGLKITNYIIKKNNRNSVIILVLSVIILLSTIGLAVLGALNIERNIRDNNTGFKNFC